MCNRAHSSIYCLYRRAVIIFLLKTLERKGGVKRFLFIKNQQLRDSFGRKTYQRASSLVPENINIKINASWTLDLASNPRHRPLAEDGVDHVAVDVAPLRVAAHRDAVLKVLKGFRIQFITHFFINGSNHEQNKIAIMSSP